MDPNAVIENFRRVVTTQYFAFDGRTRRRDFWYYVLAYFILFIIVAFVQSVLGMDAYYPGAFGIGYSVHPLTSLLELALLLPSLGISVRRLHDTDRSGWWVLIGLIPVAGWLVLIYWYTQPGTAGANRFGTDPKVESAQSAA